ncbi:RsmE family RNA methyltransferase [Pseudoleptotrichia goodfellowii]|uniref:Ribosomal RNA small subunit methyltransferase E n=1 Tax=Pseudoleptotrichia goodfellowii F0264 TaxID=596323 RepID=D0GPB6_9FUSO|nr:16S rRNA (uracil(1498)-N(3))-methyltransferase [Pseudoleptotrichia goodfellowii]EEY34063.1 RNA methyltransferase, RsmE family [Pseudoleptotrichia goodfellowii F0264]
MLTVIADKENITEKEITITDKSDCNHVQNVFRLGKGDGLRVIDGEFEYLTEITNIAKKEIKLKIIKKNTDNYSLNINIDAAIGILKNEKMNMTIKKLTEIGVSKIIPLQTERVVVKINEKKEKWDITVREALKQCKGVKFTEIVPVTKLQSINYELYDKIVYAYENSDNTEPLVNIVNKNDKNILYIVGPEGGITEEEVNFLKEKGATEISLGKRILRAETAAIVIGGILANVYN